MMLNWFGIDKYDKLHGFMMYGVMWAVGRVLRENYHSDFQVLAAMMTSIVVDGVSDVLNISHDDISGSPEFNSTLDVEYLDGIATIEDHMVILVNINKLLNHNEMGLVDETAAKENKESNEE